jgi:ABC-type protease/lipase transport system fused ATPase/permease subunit
MSEEKQEKPTRDQMVRWYKDEIELATLRSELAKQQRDATVYEAERIQAIGMIAQMTQAPSEEPDGEPSPKRTLKKESSRKDPEDGC